MRALVTGGSGFIGRNILRSCREKGWQTTSLDLDEGSYGDINVHGSILDPIVLKRAMSEVDIVFHEAAVTAPPQFEDSPGTGFNTNTQGTFNVLDVASKEGVKKVILASSSAIYGDSKQISKEDQIDLNFKNVYPMTKYFDEVIAKFFSDTASLQTICLRYFNTYGNGENTKGFYSSVIHKFIQNLRNSETPTIFANGSQSRDFIYVKDVASANLLAAKRGKSGESYNIGTGVTNTFNHIYKVIKDLMKSKVEPEYTPVPFKSYQMFTQADISKAKNELGFIPEYDLRSGISEMVTLLDH